MRYDRISWEDTSYYRKADSWICWVCLVSSYLWQEYCSCIWAETNSSIQYSRERPTLGKVSTFSWFSREYSWDYSGNDYWQYRATLEWNKTIFYQCWNHSYSRGQWIEYSICDRTTHGDTQICGTQSMGAELYYYRICTPLWQSRRLGYASCESRCDVTDYLYGNGRWQESIICFDIIFGRMDHPHIFSSCSRIWFWFWSLIFRNAWYTPLP